MSNLFARPTAPTPTPAAPAPMPDSNSPAVMEARRKAQTDIMGRAGRTSTILSPPTDRGSAGAYTSTALGAGS